MPFLPYTGTTAFFTALVARPLVLVLIDNDEDDWQEDGVEPVKPANVDIETGEIYPEITNEGRMLSDGEVE